MENEHGGKYTCTPFNDLGTEGPSTPMDVIVQHPPKLIVTPKVVYFCKLGDNITMPCEAENTGKIGPAIVWQKVGLSRLYSLCLLYTYLSGVFNILPGRGGGEWPTMILFDRTLDGRGDYVFTQWL